MTDSGTAINPGSGSGQYAWNTPVLVFMVTPKNDVFGLLIGEETMGGSSERALHPPVYSGKILECPVLLTILKNPGTFCDTLERTVLQIFKHSETGMCPLDTFKAFRKICQLEALINSDLGLDPEYNEEVYCLTLIKSGMQPIFSSFIRYN